MHLCVFDVLAENAKTITTFFVYSITLHSRLKFFPTIFHFLRSQQIHYTYIMMGSMLV